MPPWQGFSFLDNRKCGSYFRTVPYPLIFQKSPGGASDHRLWSLLELYVNAARQDEDYSEIHTIGMDETSSARGHDYITLFVDLEEKRTLFVADGKDSETVKAYTADLEEHNGKAENIRQDSCDMSPAFIKGVWEELPEAKVTFDKFHIIKIINEAVNTVRKEEAKTNPLLVGVRYALLKKENNLTAKQKTIREGLRLPGLNLKSVRVLQIRETFQQRGV